MKRIETSIPFEDELLENYLNSEDDKSFYIIDFTNSEYKGSRFLNYIYNLNLKNFIVNFEKLNDNLSEVLVEYIKTNKILSIDIFNRIWVDIVRKHLFNRKCQNPEYDTFLDNFIKNNKDLVNELSTILYSLKVFLLENMFTDNFDVNEYLKDSESFNNIGINIVSLREAPDFWDLFYELDNANLKEKKYKNFYNNSFEGYNIDKFFLKEFNPLGLMFTMSTDNYEELGKFVKELKCMSI